MGCILYELAFKMPAFLAINSKKIKDNIVKINCNLPDDCKKELSLILQKLICEKKQKINN